MTKHIKLFGAISALTTGIVHSPHAMTFPGSAALMSTNPMKSIADSGRSAAAVSTNPMASVAHEAAYEGIRGGSGVNDVQPFSKQIVTSPEGTIGHELQVAALTDQTGCSVTT